MNKGKIFESFLHLPQFLTVTRDCSYMLELVAKCETEDIGENVVADVALDDDDDEVEEGKIQLTACRSVGRGSMLQSQGVVEVPVDSPPLQLEDLPAGPTDYHFLSPGPSSRTNSESCEPSTRNGKKCLFVCYLHLKD